MINTQKVINNILKDKYSKAKVETDDMGNCKGCGTAYSFVFKRFFHKKDCPYAKEEE